MPGHVEFLGHKAVDANGDLVEKNSFDASEEYAWLLRRANAEGPEQYKIVRGLLDHLLEIANDFASNQKSANEFRPYTSEISGKTYSVFLAETGKPKPEAFMAFLALITPDGPVVFAIYSGARHGRRDYEFYDEVWTEIVRRLAVKGM